MTVVNFRIETWGKMFVLVEQFEKYAEISSTPYSTYGEALKALARVALREEMRHEMRLNRGLDW